MTSFYFYDVTKLTFSFDIRLVLARFIYVQDVLLVQDCSVHIFLHNSKSVKNFFANQGICCKLELEVNIGRRFQGIVD